MDTKEVRQEMNPEKRATLSARWGYTIAFLSGACVLVVEIAGARLLAPYFGAALFVWTSAISVVLAALALGYYIGSRLAARNDLPVVLSLIFASASVLTFVTPYLVYAFGGVVPALFNGEAFSVGLFFLSLLGALVSLMPSGIFYGMVSPLIIELLGRNHAHPGSVSGRVFAFSTIGSIVGAIFTPLILFTFLGTHLTFVLVAAIVMLLAAYVQTKSRFLFILLSVAILVFGVTTKPNPLAQPSVVHAQETPYQYIRLVDQGDHYELIFNAGFGVQSKHFKNTPWTGSYWDWVAAVPSLREKQQKHVAVLGVAAGTIPRIWQETASGATIDHVDGVDIDKAVFDIIAEYFDEDLYGINPIVKDGRHFLASTENLYDVIVVDAYINEYQIPFHLATVEFFQLVSARLFDDGVLSLNIALGEQSPLAQTISNTVMSVFEHVYRIHRDGSYNALLLASREPLDFSRLNEIIMESGMPQTGLEWEKIEPKQGGLIFTDDYAPVELFSEFSAF